MGDIEKLEEELNNVPDEYIVLIETTAEKAFEVSMALTKLLTNNRDSGIIVSANRPYSNLVSIFSKNGVDLSKIFILDCVSKNLNGEVEAENVIFLDNLSSLTDISLSIGEHLKKVNGNRRFVLFDSVTTMLIHNKPYVFARFVHNILTRMRLSGVGGILVSLKDKTSKEIRAEIAQLCDKVIQI